MFKKALGFAAGNRKAVAALAIFVPIYIKYGADTDSGRLLRLKLKFGGPIANPSPNDLPALSQKKLADAMRIELVQGIDFLSGVRIVWTEDGTDQTTAVKNVVNQPIAEGKIAGCIYLKPSMSESECAFKWFERSTSDMFGPIFRPDAFLSSVLGNTRTLPYAVIIDGFQGTDEQLARYRMLIRTFAYDAHDCKNYMVFVVTSDANCAKTILQWARYGRVFFLGNQAPEGCL